MVFQTVNCTFTFVVTRVYYHLKTFTLEAHTCKNNLKSLYQCIYLKDSVRKYIRNVWTS